MKIVKQACTLDCPDACKFNIYVENNKIIRIEGWKMQFIDLHAQYLDLKKEIDANIQKVLDHGKYIMGPEVAELEAQLADYVGVKHCITCANGTDALQMVLMAWEVKEGDAVAIEVAEEFGSYLGNALANVANVVDPDIFVIGGGVFKAGKVVLEYIEKYYSQYAFMSCKNTGFALAELGNDAGIYGAARLVL